MLTPETEQQLADMSDDDWRALTTRVRPPFRDKPGDQARRQLKARFGIEKDDNK